MTLDAAGFSPRFLAVHNKALFLNRSIGASFYEEVSIRISDLSSSGCLAAMRIPTIPPIEKPTK
jgi:hypothetical protein